MVKQKLEQLGKLLPTIEVEPPGPKSREWAERLRKVESPAASTLQQEEAPIFWEQSRGANVMDVDGNIYVDITGAFFVTSAGHSNPRIAQAIRQQSEKLLHSMGSVNPNVPRVKLAEKLAEITPGRLAVSHIANTGGEAVDLALKTARLHTGRHMVVSFHGGFHGKTFASLAVTAKNYFRQPWQPLLTGATHIPYAYCYRCPFGLCYPACDIQCAKYLEHILSNPSSGVADVAAVIAEPVQGAGGVVVPPPEFLKRIADTCHSSGVLFIADEIITGFGRTGLLFGCEHSGVVPDIMTLGKGMASGFPISAMITTREIVADWKSEQHTSTFVGHPVGCAAALASIKEIEKKNLAKRARRLGNYLRQALERLKERHPLVGDVRGLGLMATLELVKDRETKEPAAKETARVGEAALRRGLMATLRGGRYGNCVRIAPALTITQEQLEFAVETLDKSLTDVESSL